MDVLALAFDALAANRESVVLDLLSGVDFGRSSRRGIGYVVLFQNEIHVRAPSSIRACA
jgi:hypothetical protein